METIIRKVSALQIWLSHRHLPLTISFPNTFLWLPPNIEKKGIPLDDDIPLDGAKVPWSSKIWQRVVAFSY